jgi:plastocyanin/uncharacterized protein YjdB
MTLALACGGGGGDVGTGPVPVASVVITSPAAAPAFGALARTVQFSAEARGASGSPLAGKTIAWSTSNSGVATITPSGLVTAAGSGTAQITASAEGVSSAPVTVTVNQVTAGVAVTPPAAPFGAKGSTRQLAAAALDSTSHPISGKTANWTVTDAAVATVSPTGLLTSVANGTTKAIGTIDGLADTADVTVAIIVKDVLVGPGTFSFGTAGRTQQFTATPRDSNTNTVSGATVVWSSTNAAAASVSPTGLVTAVANGTAQIQATSGTATGSASVTVNIVIASLTLAPTSRTFTRIGQPQTFAPTARDTATNIVANPGITWTSRNTSLVTVSPSGVATSVADGAAYVVAAATGSGAKDSALVTVSAVANAVSITPSSVAFGAIGSSRQLGASVLDSGSTTIPGRPVTWSRVGPGTTATVSAAGLVTSVAVGTGDSAAAAATGPVAAITAKAPITVTQVVNTIAVTGSLLPDTLHTTGRTKQFAAAAADSNLNSIATVFTWLSGAPAIASVDGTGLVSAVSDGSTSIQASAGGKTGSRTMVVRRYAATFTLFPTAPQSITTAGGTLAFSGTVQDSVGTNLSISWLSRTTTVATVSPATGTTTTATAVGNGTTYVVMSGGTRIDSTQLTVTIPAAASAAVQIGDNFFRSVANNTQNAAVDTVAVGGTVTWTWVGASNHSVESTGAPSFTSSTTKISGTYAFTFNSAGTYTYDCGVHGLSMTGRVVVR